MGGQHRSSHGCTTGRRVRSLEVKKVGHCYGDPHTTHSASLLKGTRTVEGLFLERDSEESPNVATLRD